MFIGFIRSISAKTATKQDYKPSSEPLTDNEKPVHSEQVAEEEDLEQPEAPLKRIHERFSIPIAELKFQLEIPFDQTCDTGSITEIEELLENEEDSDKKYGLLSKWIELVETPTQAKEVFNYCDDYYYASLERKAHKKMGGAFAPKSFNNRN